MLLYLFAIPGNKVDGRGTSPITPRAPQHEMDVSNQPHALADFTHGRWAWTRQQRGKSPPPLAEAEDRSANP